MLEDKKACTISNCPQTAVAHEECAIAGWLLRVFFCSEHQRQLSSGIPMGGLGLDPMRVEISSAETSKPSASLGQPALGPQ